MSYKEQQTGFKCNFIFPYIWNLSSIQKTFEYCLACASVQAHRAAADNSRILISQQSLEEETAPLRTIFLPWKNVQWPQFGSPASAGHHTSATETCSTITCTWSLKQFHLLLHSSGTDVWLLSQAEKCSPNMLVLHWHTAQTRLLLPI